MSHNLLALPCELFLEVYEYLPPRSLANLALSCSTFNTLLNPLLNRNFSKNADRILVWSAYQDRPGILSRALALGTPIPFPDHGCHSIFIYALVKGLTDVVRIFLAHAANSELKGEERRGMFIHPRGVLLVYCVMGGHVEVTRMLLEAGADVNRPSRHLGVGRLMTPMDAAEIFCLDPENRGMMVALLGSWGGIRYCEIGKKPLEQEGFTVPSSPQG